MATGEPGVQTAAVLGPVGVGSRFVHAAVTTQRKWAVSHRWWYERSRDINLSLFSVQPMEDAPASETVMSSSCVTEKSVPRCLISGDYAAFAHHLEQILNTSWLLYKNVLSCLAYPVSCCITKLTVAMLECFFGMTCLFSLLGRISVKSGIHFMNMREKSITGCHTNILTVSTHIQ